MNNQFAIDMEKAIERLTTLKKLAAEEKNRIDKAMSIGDQDFVEERMESYNNFNNKIATLKSEMIKMVEGF